MFRTHYRIIPDRYAGFECQSWRWWFPFWVQCDWSNTHVSIEKALIWLRSYTNPTKWRVYVVKPEELETNGKLPE